MVILNNNYTFRSMTDIKKPILLVILDGFGYRAELAHNAITPQTAPFFFHLWNNYPHTLLPAAGKAVGLPDGYIGNSEVGHLTIGTGQLIKQPLTQLQDAIADKTFFTNPLLLEKLAALAESKKTVHIMGLVSDAGVHGHIDHMIALIQAAQSAGVHNIIIHPFLDGRDVARHSAADFLEQLEPYLNANTVIGSIHGRFYAMDRDKNWERTQKSYDVLTSPQEIRFINWQQALDYYYPQLLSEEFIPPTQLIENAYIQPGDAVICTNFRPERIVQLIASLMQTPFTGFDRTYIPIAWCITPVEYAPDIATLALLSPPKINTCLKQELAKLNKTIFTSAETEKWAHVTYFFDAYRRLPFSGETRVLIPSIKAQTYINYPCMSAPEITTAIITSLQNDMHDFYLINYANADMVGHSGDFEAAQKAITCLDEQVKKLYETAVQKYNGTLIITADHGNAEQMVDKDGNSKTSHTTNEVPFVAVNNQKNNYALPATLADITEFILQLFTEFTN